MAAAFSFLFRQKRRVRREKSRNARILFGGGAVVMGVVVASVCMEWVVGVEWKGE